MLSKKKAAQLEDFKIERQAKIKAQFERRARLAIEKPQSSNYERMAKPTDSSLRPMPKPKRIKCPKFLEFIRWQPCAVCKRPASYDCKNQPHHLHTVGSGGSDFSAVPLCAVCHTRWHNTGSKTFAQRSGVDLHAINKLLVARWRKKNSG